MPTPSVLVVEDDDNKLLQLCALLRETIPTWAVRTARSLRSGIRQVRADVPSLVLLDMTLPNYDPTPDDPGGQTRKFGGREFLKQLDRFEIHVPVIVVTQFITFGHGAEAMHLEDLDAELRNAFMQNYVGCVYYHTSIHRWRDELQSLVRAQAESC